MTGPTRFLAGLRVLERGDGVAGAAATAVLVGLGAAVTTVREPDAPMRRMRPAAADGHGLLAAVLDNGKTVLDGAPDMTGYDVVVCDRVGRPGRDIPVDLDGYARFVAGHNPGVWVTVSAFGLDGPAAGRFGTELTVAAASGLLSAVTDTSTGRPLKLAGCQALLTAGQIAALAACHGLDLARAGDPVHMDVSAQEAALATGPVLRVVHALLNCAGDAGAKRYGAPAGFYPCTDGVIRISAMEDHQWQGLVHALGDPAWADDYATTAARTEHAELIDARLAELTATMTKRACEEALQAHGVPATAMNSPEEILSSPHYRARGSMRALAVGGRSATVMGPPARPAHDGPGRRSRATGLRGLKVLEAGHVLAVPLAGALLGAMGADVTKLEDPDRMDMYRRRGPFIDSRPGVERAAYFAAVNHSKRSVSLPTDDGAALAPVVEAHDVVVENYGPGRSRRLGIDAAGLGSSRPDMLAISSSGFGHTGPWSGYRAYAYNLQTSCGLGYLTRTAAGAPVEIDMAWADLISGFALATIVAAWAVGPSGRTGTAIDFAMAELITSRFNEFLAAASLDGATEPDVGNDQRPYAPCGVYPTAEGGWIALAVESDGEWAAARIVLDMPDDPRFAGPAGRWSGRADLDAAIAARTGAWSAGDLNAALTAAGVASAEVAVPTALITDAHLGARRFFCEVEHPDWGRRRLIGLPWREAGHDPFPLRPPPLLAPSAVTP